MRIHHIALRTSDLNRLEVFYVELLELSVLQRQPGYSVWLHAGATVLMLEQADPGEPAPTPGSRDMIAFEVDEVRQHKLEKTLSAKGIRVEDRTQLTLYTRDPDGRRVGFSNYMFKK